MKPLIEAKQLCVEYGDGRRVLEGVDIVVGRGEIVGLVGDSGCGKSTLGRALLCLPKPTAGKIVFDGHELMAMRPKELLPLRRRMQIVLQDPYSALNPRMTVAALVGEGIDIHCLADGKERKRRIERMLEQVGLEPRIFLERYPDQLSGGQRQRVCIARALVVEPEFIVCDEPLSALDVTMQREILELLKVLQREFSLAVLFISHNRMLVDKVCHRVVRIERGADESVYTEGDSNFGF